MLVTWLAMISANALCGLLLGLENMEGHRYVVTIQAKHVNLFVLLALPGSGHKSDMYRTRKKGSYRLLI